MATRNLRYKDKVTVVTGGSRGNGEGCVRVFVKNGSKVVFCAPGEKDGKALAQEINEKGPGEAYYVKCDVTSEEQIKNLIDKTIEKYGKIDCLINNAGWHPPLKTIDEFSAQDFRGLFELNVMGYFLASKYALHHLRKTQGNIINTSSLVNHLGQIGSVTYCATKIYSRKRMDAVVGTVADESGHREAMIKGGEDAQLLGRMGTIEEAGELCLYLASEGSFLTGVDMPMSGGAELNFGNKNRRLPKTNIFD